VKTCTKCGVEKELSEFAKSKARKDGVFIWCKPCQRAYDKTRRELYVERERERSKKKYWANVAESRLKNKLKEREARAAGNRVDTSQWRKENPEKYRDWQKKYWASQAVKERRKTVREAAPDGYLKSKVRSLREATSEELANYRETLFIKREADAFKKFLTQIEERLENGTTTS